MIHRARRDAKVENKHCSAGGFVRTIKFLSDYLTLPLNPPPLCMKEGESGGGSLAGLLLIEPPIGKIIRQNQLPIFFHGIFKILFILPYGGAFGNNPVKK